MIENRHLRVDYLIETVAAFEDPRDLLEDIICAMSDREFDTIYQYICRMRDIEPDEEKYNQAQLQDQLQEAGDVEEAPRVVGDGKVTDWQLPNG
jgi:hypothetical protein